MSRPSSTIAKLVSHIDVTAGSADVSFVSYVHNGDTGYQCKVFDALGTWTFSGAGSYSTVDPGLWSYDNASTELTASGTNTAVLTSPAGYFSTGVGTTDFTCETIIDLSSITPANCDLRLSINGSKTELMVRISGGQLMIWSDSYPSNWHIVRNDMSGICKLRFIVQSPNLAGSNVAVWRSMYSAGAWQPYDLLMLDTYYPSVGCDKELIGVAGNCSVSLLNYSGTNSIILDRIKVKNSGVTPITLTLGESTFLRYEIHSDITSGFTPDIIGGTTHRVSSSTESATSIHIPSGLQDGFINYVAVVIIETDGSYSKSNEVSVIVPSSSVVRLFSTILGIKKKVARIFSKVFAEGTRLNTMFANIKKSSIARVVIFTTVQGVGLKRNPLFAKIKSQVTSHYAAWARVVSHTLTSIPVFASILGTMKSSVNLFVRSAAKAEMYIYLWGIVKYIRRREVRMWAVVTPTDPTIYDQWKDKFEKEQSVLQWADQLYGDINS